MFGSDAGSVIELGMYGTSSSESDEEAGGGPARAGHPAPTSEYESEYDTEYETETGTGGYDSGEYRWEAEALRPHSRMRQVYTLYLY
jgi:hypothetical protein